MRNRKSFFTTLLEFILSRAEILKRLFVKYDVRLSAPRMEANLCDVHRIIKDAFKGEGIVLSGPLERSHG
jgi:hypothetical protein